VEEVSEVLTRFRRILLLLELRSESRSLKDAVLSRSRTSGLMSLLGWPPRHCAAARASRNPRFLSSHASGLASRSQDSPEPRPCYTSTRAYHGEKPVER
jgi:hypothetical protein